MDSVILSLFLEKAYNLSTIFLEKGNSKWFQDQILNFKSDLSRIK